MSTVVAVTFNDKWATLVTARIGGSGGPGDLERIDLVDFQTRELPHSLTSEVAGAEVEKNLPEESDPKPESDESTSQSALNASLQDIEERLGEAVDSTIAVIPGQDVLYKRLILPFDDQKKIDQVAQLQLQDTIPFEIEEFVVDNQLLGQLTGSEGSGKFSILSSLAPTESVQAGLTAAKLLGLDPKIMTSRGSSVSGLAKLCLSVAPEGFGILEFSQCGCSLGLFFKQQLVHLRELPSSFQISENGVPDGLSREFLADLSCSLAQATKSLGHNFTTIYVVGTSEVVRWCRSALSVKVEQLDLTKHVRNLTKDSVPIEQISWAVGLFAAEQELVNSSSRLVDFRKGKFEYRKHWAAFWSAVSGELFYVLAAIVLGVIWLFLGWYSSNRQLKAVEDEIVKVVAAANIGEAVAPRRELETLEDKVEDLETQLRAVGSLSSLSPLDSLRELSETIGKDIDIDIESLNIGSARLFFRGSVADNPSLGRLEGALNKRKDRFCKVQVDPKGRAPGSARVSFTTDIEFCE